MFRLAVRSIRAHRARFLLPTLGVVLGVAFVAGSLLYGGAVQTAVDRAQAKAQADIAVTVTPQLIDTPLSEDLVQKLRGVSGVASVRPVADGRAFLVGKDGSLVGVPERAGGVNFDPARFGLSAGKAPANDTEVAIDSFAAEKAGFQVGDQIRVIVNGVVRQVRLVGVFTAEDGRVAGGGTLIAFDTATARAAFSPGGSSYTSIGLVAAQGVGEAQLAKNVTEVLPEGVDAATSATLNSSPNDSKLTEILLIFAAVALFVAVFLVANTFTMLAAARARENALLRAVGASRKYVLRTVLAEALVLGLVATVVGYVVGIGAALLLSKVFAVVNGPAVSLRVFSPNALLAALVVGLGVTLVAAYVPARRAAAVPPIAALRTGLPPTGKSLRRRNIAGVVVTLLGAGVTAAATQTEDLIYLGAPLLLLGLIVLTPWFGMVLTRLLRGPLTRISGMRGTLAVENTRRNPRRTAATAATLMIGLSVCAAVTVPIASVAAKDAKASETGDNADIRLTPIPFGTLNADTATQVAKVPGVQAVTPLFPARLKLGETSLYPTAVNPDRIADFLPLTVVQGSLSHLAGGLAVSASLASQHGWTVGTKVSGALASGAPVTLPIVAIFTTSSGESAFVSTKDVPPTPGMYGTILVKANGPAKDVRQAIQKTLDNPTVLVQTKAEAAEAATSQAEVFLNILYALLSVSVLIGALGVVNTMTMSTLERVREIGLLRAVGLGRKQVGSVLRLESVIIALLSAVLGVVAGCAIGAVAVLSQKSLPLVLPWDRLGIFVAVTAVIGILASLWPARTASRIPILTAIHADTE
ncbi:FtsX-like permease family protein [Actinocrispum sp. NPDC049592]|uniref:ABC transporter permease n=1 Tax=Actinocrispum sp. NPDC049592 TaxID=3154835 RepID=UPI00341B10C4